MMFRQRPPSGSKSWKWRRCDRFPPRNCNACSMARLIETVSALTGALSVSRVMRIASL